MPEWKAKVHLTIEVPNLEPSGRHDIRAKLRLHPTIGMTSVEGEFTLADGTKQLLYGNGRNTLEAVLDWLRKVEQKIPFVPMYMQGREK